jgi:hypothetical protein
MQPEWLPQIAICSHCIKTLEQKTMTLSSRKSNNNEGLYSCRLIAEEKQKEKSE